MSAGRRFLALVLAGALTVGAIPLQSLAGGYLRRLRQKQKFFLMNLFQKEQYMDQALVLNRDGTPPISGSSRL